MIMKLLGSGKKSNKAELDGLVAALQKQRQKNAFAVLSQMPTGYSWLGVYNGGKSMFENDFIGLPSYFSNSVFNDVELKQLAAEIAALKFEQISFNGFPAYYEVVIDELKRLQPALKVGIIYHGFPAELSGNVGMQATINGIVRLTRKNKIHKIGFAKKGFGLAFEKLFGVKSFELIYINPEPIEGLKKFSDGKVHAGVLVNNSFRKNFHTQVMAALLIENSIVHVTDAGELGYLDMNDRIVAHGHQEHADFIRLLGSMDLNFHVTFSEASGGQVCSESISQGVPCISNYTSSFFDYSDELRHVLIPQGADDPYFIYEKAKAVLADRENLSKKCLAYGAYLNTLAKERIATFLAY